MDNPWREGNRVEVGAAGDGATCRWRFEVGADHDLHLAVDERTPQGVQTGELIVVGGAALLGRGLALSPGRELDAVDGPGLMLELVVELLGRVLPAGPTAVAAPVAVDHAEASAPVALATLGASATFPAPWRVEGEVRRDGDGVGYRLTFTFAGDGPDPRMLELTGTWAHTDPAPALDERMSLDGWSVHALGARVGGDILDYGTRPLPGAGATLGELRAALRTRTT